MEEAKKLYSIILSAPIPEPSECLPELSQPAMTLGIGAESVWHYMTPVYMSYHLPFSFAPSELIPPRCSQINTGDERLRKPPPSSGDVLSHKAKSLL